MRGLIRTGSAADSPPPATRLEGQRTWLRQPVLADWREWALLRATSRAFLTPWEPLWHPDTLTEASYQRRMRRIANDWRSDDGYAFHVFDRRNDQLVGGIGLSNVRRGIAQAATLGYWVGVPFARQGFTGDAAQAVLAFGFQTLGLHRIEASCIPDNAPSRTLLARAGFLEEGFARSYLKIAGEWADHLLFGLVKEEWEAHR